MSLLDVVRIQQAQDRERLEIEHDLQEAQARVQGGEETFKAYVVDGHALGQELAEKRKLLDERKAYCSKLELKNSESEKNIINLENVLVMSNTNLRIQVQEETQKQEARRAELDSAREVLLQRAKEDVAALGLGLDPDSNMDLLETHPEFGFVRLKFTKETVDQMKTEIDQLEQEVHRLTEELSDFDARSSGGNGRLAKRQKMSMSTEQLAQVVAQAEETVERLRRVKEAKVAERESLNARLTADA